MPNFTWIGATSRPYWAKMLIFVSEKHIPAVAASNKKHRQIKKVIHTCRANFYQKVEIFPFWGRVPTAPTPIEVNFRFAKRTLLPLGRAKFHINRWNESPLREKNPDFHHLFETHTNNIFSHLQPAHVVRASRNFAWWQTMSRPF